LDHWSSDPFASSVDDEALDKIDAAFASHQDANMSELLYILDSTSQVESSFD
jgi:hypothetical protein